MVEEQDGYVEGQDHPDYNEEGYATTDQQGKQSFLLIEGFSSILFFQGRAKEGGLIQPLRLFICSKKNC